MEADNIKSDEIRNLSEVTRDRFHSTGRITLEADALKKDGSPVSVEINSNIVSFDGTRSYYRSAGTSLKGKGQRKPWRR